MKSSNIFEQVIMWCQYNEFETFLIKLKLHRKWRCGCLYLLLWVLVSTSTTYLSTFSPFLSRYRHLKDTFVSKGQSTICKFWKEPFSYQLHSFSGWNYLHLYMLSQIQLRNFSDFNSWPPFWPPPFFNFGNNGVIINETIIFTRLCQSGQFRNCALPLENPFKSRPQLTIGWKCN